MPVLKNLVTLLITYKTMNYEVKWKDNQSEKEENHEVLLGIMWWAIWQKVL